MNKITLLLFVLLTSIQLYGQEKDIHFEKGLSWQQLLEKAATEKKYIFADCYASWCTPCRKMDSTVFTQSNVATFFNKQFISIKVQFDTNDTLAKLFTVKYNVNLFPTYLFFTPAGILASKETGAADTDIFIANAKAAIDTNQQYYVLLDRFKRGIYDPATLLPAALKYGDMITAHAIHDAFVSAITDTFTKTQLTNIYASIPNSNSKGFKILVNYPDTVNRILEEEDRAQAVVKNILWAEAWRQYIEGRKGFVNWHDVKKMLDHKAPALADELLITLQMSNNAANHQWEEYGLNTLKYFEQFAVTMSHNTAFFMNDYLWNIFLNCSVQSTLEKAVVWSRKTITWEKGEEDVASMDTYANLLYKTGKRQEAISMEEKALRIVTLAKDTSYEREFSDKLDKMKRGVPTWD